ncbi:unnamed protein product [Rotaria sordida]|uniref:Uncharacterized protein n=2 Tax=Rotaria sordida TaxID=392033 RepID=A0A818MBR7_9BILA|nr:unnamed protein product [Rotaria sordida]CAF1052853.1 unnamed protein product [Rotaria sordida]CAF1586603.1 unnamed protein product [Rotaria sordida]CAF3578996.1 unnamed protein product [Rotaria sordida]
MVKLIIFIALLCLGLISARGPGGFRRPGGFGPSGGGNYHGGPSGDNGNALASTLCANDTLASLYVSQNQALITELNNNGSFTDLAQKRVKEWAYFQNATNNELLASNCTEYCAGLNAARADDMAAKNQRDQYTKIGEGRFKNILRSLGIGVRGDSHEK